MIQAFYQALQLVYPWESVSEIQPIKELPYNSQNRSGEYTRLTTLMSLTQLNAIKFSQCDMRMLCCCGLQPIISSERTAAACCNVSFNLLGAAYLLNRNS